MPSVFTVPVSRFHRHNFHTYIWNSFPDNVVGLITDNNLQSFKTRVHRHLMSLVIVEHKGRTTTTTSPFHHQDFYRTHPPATPTNHGGGMAHVTVTSSEKLQGDIHHFRQLLL
ncbi:hypothetical protein Bbelb_094830 [Branchiostoma belcheri]|nr:hypothetical protein Bbelb_094830 [Branchiostoma belcheri]